MTRKPKFLGLLTGAVAGLATITPAAGYVSPVDGRDHRLRRRRRLLLRGRAQEPAQAGTTRSTSGASTASAGSLGIVLLGVFATKAFNPAGADGLLAGNPGFFLAEVGAVVLAVVWAFVVHLGDALADRPRDAGPGRRGGRGGRPRRVDPRRAGVRRSAVASATATCPPARAGSPVSRGAAPARGSPRTSSCSTGPRRRRRSRSGRASRRPPSGSGS